jgi:hypothetical protein
MEVSSQMGPFSIVPEWVLDRGLSPTALKLYIVMARFADWQTGMAFPSRETLADRMGCSLKTVDRAVIEVVKAECVKKISRGRYASALYRVYQVDPRRTDLSTEWTDLNSEGTDLSSRLDTDDHLTRTTKREPLEQEPLNDLEATKSTKPSRLSKLPTDWYPSDRLLEMFATKWPNVDRDFEVEQFINYWHAEGKTKADWDKAFQVWMGRAQARAKTQRSWQQEKSKTNSQRNIENLRAKMSLLETNEMKEIENGQVTGGAVIDFGLNLRSAEDI